MAGYQGGYVQRFQNYLERSGEHKVVQKLIDTVLPPELSRMAEGKSSFDVLGVGSGGGEMDVYLISLLQSVLPSAPIRVDIVEPSADLTQNFKALVAKSPSLQGVSFKWNTVTSAEYEKQVQTKDDKFDLIHMIQMLYYVDDPSATLSFFHSRLKKNGKMLIIHEAANSGWEKMWKTFKTELCTNTLSDYLSAGDIKKLLEALGLRFEELELRNYLDISECFVEGSRDGAMLLDFMTDRESFHSSFSPEVQAGILQLLKNECSIIEGGRVKFNCSLSALLVHA
ncbi:histamine N-methyltransferase-like [Hoplias malabaricus]|uniref:histamine N-methyltransferase-like n=1 Tax=Hoplias malabaricus TaxID=27720 RepID=UPI0034628DD5